MDPFAVPLVYDWSFGDGDASAAATPSHTYEFPGPYTVVLRVVDDLGQPDLDTIEITVEEPPPAWGEASVVGVETTSPSKGLNYLIALLIPIGAVLLWKGLRRR